MEKRLRGSDIIQGEGRALMDVATVLKEVDSWPVEDRLRLMEAMWDRMVEDGYEPELTEAQKAELERRMAELDENPGIAIPWEEVQAYVRRPR